MKSDLVNITCGKPWFHPFSNWLMPPFLQPKYVRHEG